MLTAIMTNDAHLLGTGLKLFKGQRVQLTPATNIPDGDGKYFASPVGGFPGCDEMDSILLDTEDLEPSFPLTEDCII
jgi:hypothetical protein